MELIVVIILIIFVFILVFLISLNQNPPNIKDIPDFNQTQSNSHQNFSQLNHISTDDYISIHKNLNFDDNSDFQNSLSSSSDFSDDITNPAKCYLPYNIYHDTCFDDHNDIFNDSWDSWDYGSSWDD